MLVIVEGTNGAGKTTLAKNMEQHGYRYVRLPGFEQVDLCVELRRLLNDKDMPPYSRFLLFLADMTAALQLIADNPTVDYVMDRSWLSTLVYQHGVMGLPRDLVEDGIRRMLASVELPDIKLVLLVCEPDVIAKRLSLRSTKTISVFSNKDRDYYARIQGMYVCNYDCIDSDPLIVNTTFRTPNETLDYVITNLREQHGSKSSRPVPLQKW